MFRTFDLAQIIQAPTKTSVLIVTSMLSSECMCLLNLINIHFELPTDKWIRLHKAARTPKLIGCAFVMNDV